MRDRWIVVVGVVGALVLVGAGVGVAAMAGAFSSGSSAATTTAFAPSGSFGDSQGRGFRNGTGPSPRGGGIFDSLNAAATYLGVSSTQLFTDIRGGQSLAQLAKAQGKTTAGLVGAMVAAEKNSLASAVSSGQITQAQAQQFEANLDQRITRLVNGGFTRPGGGGFGGRGGTATTGLA